MGLYIIRTENFWGCEHKHSLFRKMTSATMTTALLLATIQLKMI